MSWYEQLIAFHSKSRPVFILVTECAAIVGTMAVMLGIAFVRELLP